MKVPITTSELVDTPYVRVKDLVSEGIPEIPILGMTRSVKTMDGSIFNRHRGMEITYCEHGSVKFDCDGKTYSIFPGEVFVSHPEDVHRRRINPKGSTLYWIFLELPPLGERLLGLDVEASKSLTRILRSLPHRTFCTSREVGSCYERMFQILDTEKPKSVARRFRLQMAALQLLIALIEASPAEEIRDPRLQSLITRMRREPQEGFSIGAAARELHCSPNTVRARFKKFTGISPRSFMMKCRIHRAQDFLREGKMSVTEIAAELGFSSSQNFAVRFRQETGKSPTEWRRENA